MYLIDYSIDKYGNCTYCDNPELYCECATHNEKLHNDMWQENVEDKREKLEWRTPDEIEYDEAMEKPLPSHIELKALLKDEIETLVDLNLD